MPDGDGVWIYDQTAKPMLHFGSQPDPAPDKEGKA